MRWYLFCCAMGNRFRQRQKPANPGKPSVSGEWKQDKLKETMEELCLSRNTVVQPKRIQFHNRGGQPTFFNQREQQK